MIKPADPANPPSPAALREYCRECLAGFKAPGRVVFRCGIPTHPVGQDSEVPSSRKTSPPAELTPLPLRDSPSSRRLAVLPAVIAVPFANASRVPWRLRSRRKLNSSGSKRRLVPSVWPTCRARTAACRPGCPAPSGARLGGDQGIPGVPGDPPGPVLHGGLEMLLRYRLVDQAPVGGLPAVERFAQQHQLASAFRAVEQDLGVQVPGVPGQAKPLLGVAEPGCIGGRWPGPPARPGTARPRYRRRAPGRSPA